MPYTDLAQAVLGMNVLATQDKPHANNTQPDHEPLRYQTVMDR